jgi:hypothetical protein
MNDQYEYGISQWQAAVNARVHEQAMQEQRARQEREERQRTEIDQHRLAGEQRAAGKREAETRDRQARLVLQQQIKELDARIQQRILYPGSNEQFESAWPRMWTSILEQGGQSTERAIADHERRIRDLYSF